MTETGAALLRRAAELRAVGNIEGAVSLLEAFDRHEAAAAAYERCDWLTLATLGGECIAGVEVCPGCDAWRPAGSRCPACGYDGAF